MKNREYCVTWRRKPGRLRRRIYQTPEAAASLRDLLETPLEDQDCAGGVTDPATGECACACSGMLYPVEDVKILSRPVGEWAEVDG
jgi:hypothetical protein